MPSLSSSQLKSVLSAIEEALSADLPRAALSVHPGDESYGLFVLYQDFSVDDEFRPQVGWGTVANRDRLLTQFPDDRPSGLIWNFWNVHTENIRQTSLGDAETGKLIRTVYLHLLASSKGDLPPGPEEEAEILMPFRELIYRVTTRANRLDWLDDLVVSSEFVVVPSDVVSARTLGDMKQGIPSQALRRLQQAGWMD